MKDLREQERKTKDKKEKDFRDRFDRQRDGIKKDEEYRHQIEMNSIKD